MKGIRNTSKQNRGRSNKVFGIGNKTENAFLYCLTGGHMDAVLIDSRKLTIGNSPKCNICLDREWIGSRLAETGWKGQSSYYFKPLSDKYFFLNGQQVSSGISLVLEDRDAILVRSKESQNWVLFWFRVNSNEIDTKWMKKPINDVAGILPMEWHQDSGWYIHPRNTENRTYVDKKIADEILPVRVGMTVQSGPVSGVFAADCFYYQILTGWKTETQPGQSSHSDGGILSIDISEKTVGLIFKKTLLRNIHIDVEDGEMVLILGSSGAGKSTFMDAVIGYEEMTGTITYNGRPLEELRRYGNAIGYVPQHNIVREGDTVGHAVRSAAKMSSLSSDPQDPGKLNERVQHTLEILGLKEKEKAIISKLSGGEKKRVNVAAAYITNPKIFFLDEPDTGLDTVQGEILMKALRDIADEGRIVMIITHAPDRKSTYYDKVLVIAKNRQSQCGEPAFFGTREKAFEFFGETDFEGVVRAISDNDAEQSRDFVLEYQNLKPGRKGIM